MVIINPNNPTGAVYSRAVLEALVRIAEKKRVVLFSDEIYDRILYDGAEHVPVATLCKDTLCATFGGLSKVYRACGFRIGWVFFSGAKRPRGGLPACLELLASLRLCSNVPGQWAVQTALGGVQSIYELTAPTGGSAVSAARSSTASRKLRVPRSGLAPGCHSTRSSARPRMLPDFDDTASPWPCWNASTCSWCPALVQCGLPTIFG